MKSFPKTKLGLNFINDELIYNNSVILKLLKGKNLIFSPNEKMAKNQYQSRNGKNGLISINIGENLPSETLSKDEKNCVKTKSISGLKKSEILIMLLALIAISAFLCLLKYLVSYLGEK